MTQARKHLVSLSDTVYYDCVSRCVRICLGKRKINLSSVFAGQTVGIREVDDQIWLVSFLEYDLGYFDKERDRVEPGPSPFAPDKVLTMCPEYTDLKWWPGAESNTRHADFQFGSSAPLAM